MRWKLTDDSDTGETHNVKTAKPSKMHLKGQKEGSSGKRRMARPKMLWNKDEISIVEKHLSECIRLNKVSKKYEAERALAAAPLLRKNRTWKDVKYFAYNRLKNIGNKSVASLTTTRTQILPLSFKLFFM